MLISAVAVLNAIGATPVIVLAPMPGIPCGPESPRIMIVGSSVIASSVVVSTIESLTSAI